MDGGGYYGCTRRMTDQTGYKVLHDRVASTLSLARTVLSGIDPGQDMTLVRTASLKLLLETLIELGEPSLHQKTADTAKRTVEGMIAPKLIEGGQSAGRWL